MRHLTWKPEVVWVVEPPIFATPSALLLAKLTGARSWLHIQDFEVQAGFSLGLFRNSLLKRVVLATEAWIMRRFSRVSTICATMADRVSASGIPRGNVPVFPNWVDLNVIRPLVRPSVFRRKLGIPDDAVVALYSGNMGAKQGLEILAQLASMLAERRPDIRLVFCGEGASRAELEAQCQELPNVTMLALQPFEQLNELLGLADIHLVPQRPTVAGLMLPSKLGASSRPDDLWSRRPILAPSSPP